MSNHTPIALAPDFETRYPDSSAQATEAAMNLVLTADQLEKRIAGLLQPFDLSPATGLVLSILADTQEPVSPNLIADRLIISRASVTSLLDSLEKRGYIRRQPHHFDRRMLRIELTQAGRKVADQFRPLVHQQEKQWLNVLTDKEQVQFIHMLHRIQASFKDTES